MTEKNLEFPGAWQRVSKRLSPLIQNTASLVHNAKGHARTSFLETKPPVSAPSGLCLHRVRLQKIPCEAEAPGTETICKRDRALRRCGISQAICDFHDTIATQIAPPCLPPRAAPRRQTYSPYRQASAAAATAAATTTAASACVSRIPDSSGAPASRARRRSIRQPSTHHQSKERQPQANSCGSDAANRDDGGGIEQRCARVWPVWAGNGQSDAKHLAGWTPLQLLDYRRRCHASPQETRAVDFLEVARIPFVIGEHRRPVLLRPIRVRNAPLQQIQPRRCRHGTARDGERTKGCLDRLHTPQRHPTPEQPGKHIQPKASTCDDLHFHAFTRSASFHRGFSASDSNCLQNVCGSILPHGWYSLRDCRHGDRRAYCLLRFPRRNALHHVPKLPALTGEP